MVQAAVKLTFSVLMEKMMNDRINQTWIEDVYIYQIK